MFPRSANIPTQCKWIVWKCSFRSFWRSGHSSRWGRISCYVPGIEVFPASCLIWWSLRCVWGFLRLMAGACGKYYDWVYVNTVYDYDIWEFMINWNLTSSLLFLFSNESQVNPVSLLNFLWHMVYDYSYCLSLYLTYAW